MVARAEGIRASMLVPPLEYPFLVSGLGKNTTQKPAEIFETDSLVDRGGGVLPERLVCRSFDCLFYGRGAAI